MRFARLLSFCALGSVLASCGSAGDGDPKSDLGVPPPAGKDLRIREIAAPGSPLKAAPLTQVAVSGAVVIAVDTYDETTDGKSRGSIFVQDIGSKEPYSGIGLFAPSFVPGNLRVGSGDVLDLRGQYQENQTIGTTVTFAPGAVLPQLARPIGTFRFETTDPVPVDIDVKDLADYTTGRKWMNMLVRVKNVTPARAPFKAQSGRISVDMLPSTAQGQVACEDPFPKTPTLVNELVDISQVDIQAGKPIQSIVGVVTYFCNFHLAPRRLSDITP